MPITKSAKKALRGSSRKRAVNLRLKKKLDSAVKEAKKTGSKSLAAAYKAIDKAAKKGLIKKGAADRKKSRLAAFIKKAAK